MFFKGFELEHVAIAGGNIRLRRGGKGPPLLLLHGNPQTHPMWHKIAEEAPGEVLAQLSAFFSA